jgi:hypothetical protein
LNATGCDIEERLSRMAEVALAYGHSSAGSARAAVILLQAAAVARLHSTQAYTQWLTPGMKTSGP